MASTAEQSRRFREDHIARGLCTYCNAPIIPGKRKCAKHLKWEADYQRQRANKRAAQGKCPYCGDKPVPGQRLCRLCNIAAAENTRRWRQRRIDAGVCVRCAKRRPDHESLYCRACKEFEMRRRQKRRALVKLRKARAGEFLRLFRSKPMDVAMRMEQLFGVNSKQSANA